VAPSADAHFATVADGDRYAVMLDVHLLLERGFEVLLVRRTGPEGGTFHLPTGPVHARESLTTAAARIARETIGIEIDSGDLRFGHALHDAAGTGRLGFYFATTRWNGVPALPDGPRDLLWVPNTDPPDQTDFVVASALDDYMHGTQFSQVGWMADGYAPTPAAAAGSARPLPTLGWASDG
jgi:ADP-ribose pyrophosphatase YjhB (NUDIX family)